jgi:hypothetical protein
VYTGREMVPYKISGESDQIGINPAKRIFLSQP